MSRYWNSDNDNNNDSHNSFTWEDVNKTWDYTQVAETSSVTAAGHGWWPRVRASPAP